MVYHLQGPVDYDTFLDIGGRFVAGREVYGVNSYYPMPYVLIFAGFSLLPKWLSLLLWLSLPVIAAIIISEGSLWALAFAPLFAHFVGGQSALPAMLGVWGYRRSAQKFSGGLWLALTALKPQLGIFPVAWAAVEWYREWRAEKRLPASLKGFVAGALALYLPSFLLYPTWPLDWLQSPRPLSDRAMAGIVPRTLHLLGLSTPVYWLILLGIAVLLFMALRQRLTFEKYLLWSFIVSPLVHDYDLIQLISILRASRLRLLAVLLSLPTWWVVAAAYANDSAWYAVTIIAPGLLVGSLLLDKRDYEINA